MSSETAALDTVRSYVVDELKPLLPERWDWKPGITTPGEISKPTVYLEYSRIEPLPEAPIGNVRCVFELTVTTPLKSMTKGEDEVDAEVVGMILVLDAHDRITWTGAEKKVIDDTNLAWTVTVSVLASTVATPAPPTPDPEPDTAPDETEE